jgi:hypothetical protein
MGPILVYSDTLSWGTFPDMRCRSRAPLPKMARHAYCLAWLRALPMATLARAPGTGRTGA